MSSTDINKVFGYARVSTSAQTLDQQLDALTNVGVLQADIFTDKASGTKTDREGLNRLLEVLRDGDTVTVIALDRLGRSTIQVLTTLRELEERGVIVRSLREQLDLSTPTGRVVAAVMSALAEMELALIRERAAAAREAAAARGKQIGRPRALSPEQTELVRRMKESGESVRTIASTLSVSRATVYRAVADAA